MKRTNFILFVLIFFGLFQNSLTAQEMNLTRAAEWGTGYYNDVALNGNYAYCAASLHGFDIIDIGNRANPVKVGGCTTSNSAVRVDVSGNYAYLSTTYELVIVDISVPASPVVMGSYYGGGYVADTKVKGNYAYLAGSDSGSGGLTIVDVSAPSAPFKVGQYTLNPSYNYAEAVFITGNSLYLLEDFKMHILDITNPTAPVWLGQSAINLYAVDIFVDGNYAYASSYLSEIGYTEAYLDIIDISNPAAPVNLGTYSTGGGMPGGIYTDDNYAYFAVGKDGLHIVDISTPSAPSLVRKYETPGRPEGLAMEGNSLFVADNYGGLQILDNSAPSDPSTVGAFDHSANITDVTVNGNYAYASGNEEGVLIFNVSTPSSPLPVSSIDAGGRVEKIVVAGNHAYVVPKHTLRENVLYESLVIIDISNPLSPSIAGTYQSDSMEIADVHVNGNYAYVTGDAHALAILDISNPSQITVTGTYELMRTFTGVWAAGNYAYLADSSSFVEVIDVSDPANPDRISGIGAFGYIGGIVIQGNYAYITGSEFNVLDFSDPANPAFMGDYDYGDFGSASRLHVQGDYAYITNDSGLLVLDVSNPASPTFAADYDADNSKGIYVDGDVVYLTGAGFGKLLVLSREQTTTTPVLHVNPTQLNFAADTAGVTGPTQTITIGNSGQGTLDWELSDSENWITCTPLSGIGSGVVEISVDARGLAAGIYNGAVIITSPNATNSPQTVEVNLNVTVSGQTASPFGEFETPTPGAVVFSSVPFTGWALDDVAVETVQLYREEQGGALIYIGDAVFVEGARPDVALQYPGYPNNHKAGWGYMMLTNFLPNGGNGTFTIHAVAADAEGNRVTLGTRTITCDNANAVKPFGAIDTPAQGGTASGNSYRNNGWVLTPMPNTVPTDGSTINVYVNGVNLGHPVYDIYRSDVATLFPGYANSDGAHAYFDIDTTTFENGVHTIFWTASDDAGNIDGIGSRYFTIENTGNREQGLGIRERRGNPVWLPDPVWLPGDVLEGATCHVVESKELERVELRLGGNITAAYQVVGREFRPLPWGTFLDRKTGTFYWQPGHGYVGRYRLTFIETDGSGNLKRTDAVIVIHPRF
ncbi:MAG: hypothetical protein GY950_07315 [bacterium]|nr:hypothetical protein [bacterium]